MNNLATQIREAVEGDKHTHYTELLLQAAELLDHKDTQINTLPAAPVDGLETWKFHAPLSGSAKMIQSPDGDYVSRSQAEAIIAAERVEKEKADKRVEFLLKQISRAADDRKAIEADNAALTARVKELELIRDSHSKDTLQALLEKQALETQLAAIKKALAKLTLHSNSLALAHVHKTQKSDGIWGALKEARAARRIAHDPH